MSLFFASEISENNPTSTTVHVALEWHPKWRILAVGAYSEDKGGYVSLLVDDDKRKRSLSAETRDETNTEGIISSHPTAQVTSMAWHPDKRLLAVGWDNGDVSFNEVRDLDHHRDGIRALVWSSSGTRLICSDENGSVVGWEKCSSSDKWILVFHHELKDPLTGGLMFREDGPGESMAKAAVAGDAKALELFTDNSWKVSGENLNAYAGSQNGIVYYLNENGGCMEVLQAEGPVRTLLRQGDILLVITESMVVGQFRMEMDGSLDQINKVKMSTTKSKDGQNKVKWVGRGVLAISSGSEASSGIRIWNLKTDDNFFLSIGNGDSYITTMCFDPLKNILGAGTASGEIHMWTYEKFPDEAEWRILPKVNLGSNTTKDISFAPSLYQRHSSIHSNGADAVLAVNSIRRVFLLKERILVAHYFQGVSALQSGPSDATLTFHDNEGVNMDVNAGSTFQIRGLWLSEKNLILWGADKVLTYEVQKDIGHLLKVGEFSCSNIMHLVSYEKSIYCLERDKIHVRSFQGTIKQALPFNEYEGTGMSLSITRGDILVSGTTGGVIKIWDLSKRDAKPHVHPIHFKDLVKDFGYIHEAKVNSTGTYLSVSYYKKACEEIEEEILDSRLYLIELENTSVRYFNIASGRNDMDDGSSVPPNSAEGHAFTRRRNSSHTLLSPLVGRKIISHEWDLHEPHLLICLCSNQHSNNNNLINLRNRGSIKNLGGDLLLSLFVHDDFGVVVHDVTSYNSNPVKLIGVSIPFIVLIKDNYSAEQDSAMTVERFVMKDFLGLEDSDKPTRDAVVRFSFYLSIGNMDEAFKSIKSVKNPHVWGNMARMCVKTQRLDVAVICLGNMGHAYGARAVKRIIESNENLDVKTATLAVHLGMLEEAEALYIRSGNYNFLNKLYQDSGQWQKAVRLAEEKDRMHLRSTYYNYAKHLESRGDIAGAIQNYEKSGTHRFEVPRLLFEDWTVLENYVIKSNDKALKRWWAQYMESTGEMEIALQYYDLADDYLSLVRVYCYCEDLEKASEIANKSGDRAACYHLARQYENIDDVEKAVNFFAKAQAYSNAIRICKERGFMDRLWNLALLAPPNEKLEAARTFENADKPSYDKAVILYEKAGYLGKALDLAIETNQHNVLQYISSNLDESADPELLKRTANFFLQHEQFEKAVDLFAASGQRREALVLCSDYNIKITDDLEQKLTDKLEEKESNNNERISILNHLAEVCYQQGNYHLATKKWTQAGNRLQAMKALLKSGDTEKIIFFANVSREKDIYILAGNYLQTLDWRNDPEIMRNIISFYTKSKAYDNLSWFYSACSEVEIDEYQNYEKALGALNESLKCLDKSNESFNYEERLRELKRVIGLVTKFVEIQRLYESGQTGEALAACKELTKTPDINTAVRSGDIYGFMIEHYSKNRNYKTASTLIDELKNAIPQVNLRYFINVESLRTIDSALGTDYDSSSIQEKNPSSLEKEEGNAFQF
ncbi:intraflagellar transport protein 140 homolog [Lepeophtheirus salmonis]|uniref:intraflagellar transport protein 140 homolog n=1 Tax=Lepeophtheirus salmonis TaxID=72036 RepID=UPI001AE163B9|nr:intraflagellar transport protein 140 homolog [Lepeophtheirus salmonis]